MPATDAVAVKDRVCSLSGRSEKRRKTESIIESPSAESAVNSGALLFRLMLSHKLLQVKGPIKLLIIF